jgi:predicted DNA-binding transcriptional regulator YafY
VAAVVSAIRVGDRASVSRPLRVRSASAPTDVVALLREAAEAGEQLVIGYVGNDGTVGERVVTPESVEGGRLLALDARSDATRAFALHRITAVSRTESP